MGACTSSKYKDVGEKDDKRFILTPHDVTLIKNSWKVVVKGGLAKHGTSMMIKIFLEHKDLKPLWKFARNLETEEEMNSSAMLKAHGEKLFNAIDMAVNSLDDLNTLVPILIQLGYSHCRWGVKEEHFQIIGGVLISTLQDAIKEGFTPKVKKAWIKVYGVLAAQMKIGMKQYESEQKANNTNNNNANETPNTANNTDTNQVTLDMTNSSNLTTNMTSNTTTNTTKETDLSRENGHVKNGFIETAAN